MASYTRNLLLYHTLEVNIIIPDFKCSSVTTAVTSGHTLCFPLMVGH